MDNADHHSVATVEAEIQILQEIVQEHTPPNEENDGVQGKVTATRGAEGTPANFKGSVTESNEQAPTESAGGSTDIGEHEVGLVDELEFDDSMSRKFDLFLGMENAQLHKHFRRWATDLLPLALASEPEMAQVVACYLTKESRVHEEGGDNEVLGDFSHR
jgi:hypothetical protein